ncbi:MAG: energy-coupling factor ABC transporter permease [Candidatus Thorarchaeota archaeon]
MHLPDGFLSIPVLLLVWAITLLALAYALNNIKADNLDKIANIGAIASVIFVAQMFNFPITGGTTGHLLGGALAVYVVGVPGAIIVMFTVLLLQATIFADGGIVALGANMFNMGVVTILTTYFINKISDKVYPEDNINKNLPFIFIAGFSSVFIASFFAGLELVLSQRTTFAESIPLILFYHILIGLGEGIITVFIVIYLQKSEFPLPDVFNEETPSYSFLDSLKESNKPILGLALLLFILSMLSLFSFPNPDGLSSATSQLFPNVPEFFFKLGIANDYDFLGLGGFLGTILSAILGIIIISGVFILPTKYFKERKRNDLSASKH